MSDTNDKLIEAKQKLAEKRAGEGKGIGREFPAPGRLPPGQKLVTDAWPVLDLGLQPDIPPDMWLLKVSGAADERTFKWEEFLSLPQTALVTDFHCVTTWSIYDARIQGVLWQDFLIQLNVKAEATHVMFHGYDGYTTNVPLSELAQPDVALIHSFDGKPLERVHGGPVRMWVPQLYGWKSAKWLKAIEFMSKDKRGFWEVRGYHNHGNPWKEERYS
ncbi:MAG: molybdopterin-dependent oxidoreductase [Planctomycetes bacterium]|nr:molybdopterin-dependent oxidoreductase [Planctomycetota bacterium]